MATNGYDIWVSTYSRRRDGKGWITVSAGSKHGRLLPGAGAGPREAARDATAELSIRNRFLNACEPVGEKFFFVGAAGGDGAARRVPFSHSLSTLGHDSS
jgi:hypothetical protein